MQLYRVLLNNIFLGVFLTVAITGYIVRSIYKQIRVRQKMFGKTKEGSLIKQTKIDFEELLHKHLQFPIATG